MPSDTAIPGLARRRLWSAPDVVSHSLIVLTLPRLYLAPPGPPPKPEFLAALEKTYDVERVLGPLGTTIDMLRVDRVQLNLVKNAVRIEHTPPMGGTVRTNLVFNKPETADLVFSKIWRRLGTEFTLRPDRPDTLELVRTPLLAMMGFALGTAGLCFGLNALADVHGGNDWITAGVLPGWRAVCVAGGAAVAMAHVWLYRRLNKPPERLELVRTASPPF